MREKIVLFGVGKLLEQFENIVNSLEYEVIFYTDNDFNKWGKFINNKVIIPPDSIVKYDCKIFISAAAEKEISSQLIEMGLGDRIIYHEDLKKQIINEYIQKWKFMKNKEIKENRNRTIFFDSMFCLGWGGLEIWNYKLALGLFGVGEHVKIFRDNEQGKQDEKIELISEIISSKKTEYILIIYEIVNKILNSLPCVIINNWTEHVFVAACIVKAYFPDKIKIVTVSHFDEENEMTKIATYENYFDCIFCVSSKIKDKFNEVYKIESSKLLFKETSVEFEEDYERKYEDKECINIGYAARLFIKQKRADLLKEVITLLEKNSINYFLDIAGEGDYRENLEKFVHENNLMKKVRVRGFVKKSQMPDFWKNQDIYINVSEYEGTSQAMLEAMSYCVVPIVTNVSGVDDFIKNGVNGFSCDIGDIDTLIEKITYLSNNRQKLYDMGQNARKVIIDKCRLSDYIMFFVNNLK